MTVLVTGASRGIGKALVDTYASRGTPVIGAARHPPDDGPAWMALDVADPASIHAAAERLGDQPLDLLICDAGIFPDKGHDIDTGFPPDYWADVFRVNVTGVFLTVQAFLGHLRQGEGPRVAVIASRLGSSAQAEGGRYIYRASKAAAVNLARNLAVDLATQGIAVGAYHPGWVRTDMGGPKGEIGLADSVAGLVARFEELNLETTGCFRTWDGRDLPF